MLLRAPSAVPSTQARQPSMWRVRVRMGLLLLLLGSAACGRDEPPVPPAWYSQSVAATWRRYPVTDEAGARQMTVRRRGPTVSIVDTKGLSVLRLSLRRSAESVVVRDKEGVRGHTEVAQESVAFVDPAGEVQLRIERVAAHQWRLVDSTGAPLVAFDVAAPESADESVVALRGTETICKVRTSDDELVVEDGAGKVRWHISRRADLGTLGMALLALDTPALVMRAALAVHLAEMPPSTVEQVENPSL